MRAIKERDGKDALLEKLFILFGEGGVFFHTFFDVTGMQHCTTVNEVI